MNLKKYILSSLAGGIAMFVAASVYMQIEALHFGMEIYSRPLFYGMDEINMGTFMGLFFLLKLFHAGLLSYLHEKLPRCGSGLWSKVWRFTGFAWILVFGVGLLMTLLTMPVEPKLLIASWALGGLFQTLICSFVIIPILYRFPAPDLSCRIKN